MQPRRNSTLIYGLLAGAWLLVVGWQVEEHQRVVEASKSDLRGSSHEIARTLGAVTRAMSFRGTLFQDRLDPVLKELVKVRTNALVNSSGLLAVSLLNAEGDPLISAGNTNLLSRETLGESERWSDTSVTFVLPIEGASFSSEGLTNEATVVIPHNPTNDPGRDFRRGPPPDGTNNPDFGPPGGYQSPFTNAAGQIVMPPPPNDMGDRPRGGYRRPPWMRGMSDAEFKTLVTTHELHGLVLAMSTENYRAICVHDLWLRFVIAFFAGMSAAGAGLALRNVSKTRNPLNIIRGLAQMLSKQTDAPPDIREKTRVIMDETDKVTAQLTEFINYSRPREVRRSKIALKSAFAEVLRTLNHDLEEKKLRVETGGEQLSIEADEQLLRQVLFNLLINAIQAVGEGGQIQIQAKRESAIEASLEIRDDGTGVSPEQRQEIFKPYFTTHQKGTGLGLAVVSQIVLAHGWEIQCLPNTPKGAIFRITHLKLAV